MHRSGTSAVSRVVNLLGVDLGPSLMPTAPDNPSGFWEHKEIVEINEELFYVLGRHWTRFLTPLPENWWLREDIRPFQQRLVALLRRDFSDSAVWGLKDPRLCRLLPLWRLVVEEIDCQCYFLHVIRNPLEVADSLNRRDGLPRNVSMILWLQHVLEAERETRGHPRVFVTFDQLLGDWRFTMRRVALAFQWNWDEAILAAGPHIDPFLNLSMRHHDRGATSGGDNGLMPHIVAGVYDAVVNASMGDQGGMMSVFDGLSHEMNAATSSLLGELVVPELESQISRVMAAEKDVAELRSQLSLCQAALGRILESRSWRLTSPLRRIFDYWTRNKN